MVDAADPTYLDHVLRHRRITVGALRDVLDDLPRSWVLVPNPITGDLLVFDSRNRQRGYVSVVEAGYVEF